MRTILIVLVLLIVGIAGLGFCRGWFQLSSDTGNAGHSINATITVDEDKIRDDKEKLQDLGHQEQEETGVANEQKR